MGGLKKLGTTVACTWLDFGLCPSAGHNNQFHSSAYILMLEDTCDLPFHYLLATKIMVKPGKKYSIIIIAILHKKDDISRLTILNTKLLLCMPEYMYVCCKYWNTRTCIVMDFKL